MKRTYENYCNQYELCPCGYSEATKNLHFSQSQLDLFLDKYFEPLKLENQQLKSEQNNVAIEKLEELKQRYYETIDDCGQLNYECELNDYGMFIKLNRMIKELKGEK